MTELIFKGDNSKTILISYQTPVAVVGFDFATKSYYEFKSEKKWSATTTRHINQWLNDMGIPAKTVKAKPQEYFDNLVKAVA